MSPQQHVTEEIDTVSFKLPPFCTDKPELWFYQVESLFFVNNITEEDKKYYHLVSQLEYQFFKNIYGIIGSKDKDKYTKAKVLSLIHI